ncbi:MAG: YkgJ family cysteine cluster protein [Gammaproteobacteria bacterium]|nr:YkgJ family cysteine cluster protein [Gammaproteobacteria bacterium]
MDCRPGCGACCMAPSISSFIPGMPFGKPAGVTCIQLDALGLCQLFGQSDRPLVCASFRAAPDTCGESTTDALKILAALEIATL